MLDAVWRRGGEVAVRDLQPRIPGRRLHDADDDDGPAAPEGRAGARARSAARSSTGPASSREELESGLVTRALQPLLQGDSARADPVVLRRGSEPPGRPAARRARAAGPREAPQAGERTMTCLAARRSDHVVLLRGGGDGDVDARSRSPRRRWRAGSTRMRPPARAAVAVPSARAAGRAARRSCAFGVALPIFLCFEPPRDAARRCARR